MISTKRKLSLNIYPEKINIQKNLSTDPQPPIRASYSWARFLILKHVVERYKPHALRTIVLVECASRMMRDRGDFLLSKVEAILLWVNTDTKPCNIENKFKNRP